MRSIPGADKFGFLKYIPDAVVVFDSDWRVVFLNAAAVELYRKSLNACIGETFEQFFTLAAGGSRHAEIRALVLKNGSWRGDALHKTNGGPTAAVDWSISKCGLENNAAGYLAITRDIGRYGPAENARLVKAQALDPAPGDGEALERRRLDARLRALYDNSPLAIGFSSEGITVGANGAYVGLFGYESEQELIGRSLLDQIAPRARPDIIRKIEGRKRGEPVPRSYETVGLRKDGGEFPFWIHVAQVGVDGEPLTMVVIQDITERKKAESEIREHEEQLRFLNENLADGMVYQIDSGTDGRERRFSYLSPAVNRLHGLSVDEAARNPGLIYQQVVEEDRPILAETESRAYASGTRLDIDVRMRTATGEVRWRRFISSPRRLADGRTVWDGIELDITERKRMEEALRESEQKYRILVEESTDPIFSFTPEGQYTYANRALAEGFGKPLEAIIGKRIWDIFPKEEADRRFELLSRVFRTGEPLVIEGRVPRPGGDRYYVTSITPIKNAAGETTSAICSSMDVTDRKRVEDEMWEKQRILKDATPYNFKTLDEIGCSPRECETVSYLAMGYTNRQIADAMGIKEITVKKFLESVGRKLEAKGRVEIMMRALEKTNRGH